MPSRHVRSRGQTTAVITNGNGGRVGVAALQTPPGRGPVPTQAAQPADPPGSHSGLDLLLRTLGGIAGGVGVLGFVVLVGGTIVFARLSAAGLPADEAVGDMPRDALLVIGAKALLPFGVGVVLGSVALFGIDRLLRRRDRRRVRFGIAIAVAVGGVVLHVLLVLSTHAAPVWWTYLLLAGLAAALVGLVALVALNEDVVWFLLAGILAAGLFSETSVLIRTFSLTTVRPVALELNDGSVLGGVYLAETATQVLVGETCTDPHDQNIGDASTGFMRVVAREQVKALVIGTNGSLAEGIRREPQLAASLPGAPKLTAVHGASTGQWCTSPAARAISLSPIALTQTLGPATRPHIRQP
jgi:hypothetical protein